jgi:hypothetical protein
MTRKIAVAVIHGIGSQTADFADTLIDQLTRWCSPKTGLDVVIRPVHWANVLLAEEIALITRLHAGGTLRFPLLRGFMVNFIADAVAYQVTPHDRETYDAIHAVFAAGLRDLAAAAGADAPLCIIAHSLGSIIASNYIYDLQHQRLLSDEVRAQMADSPLERGETLALLYTLGSPLALWSLRYHDFGKPIMFPPPQLATHCPPDMPAEWINFYDPDDVISAPLKTLNEQYADVVTEDRAVNVGGIIEQWNPLSHLRYLSDKDVVRPIADRLIAVWSALNP